MCSDKQTGTRGLVKCRTEAGQITEGFPLQLQSLLCSAEPCWDLEMWNVATDKGHKKKKSEHMAGFLWPVPINTRIQKRVSVSEGRT